jgi:hypothetical protein
MSTGQPDLPGMGQMEMPSCAPMSGGVGQETRRTIDKTIVALSRASFTPDPLFGANSSLLVSLMNSGVKRAGLVIESAIRDAARHAGACTVGCVKHIRGAREIDFSAYRPDLRQLLALDIKRGGHHDSGHQRDMRETLIAMQSAMRDEAARHQMDVTGGVHYGFLHWYSDTDRNHVGAYTIDQLELFARADLRAAVAAATIAYRRELQRVIRERTGHEIAD